MNIVLTIRIYQAIVIEFHGAKFPPCPLWIFPCVGLIHIVPRLAQPETCTLLYFPCLISCIFVIIAGSFSIENCIVKEKHWWAVASLPEQEPLHVWITDNKTSGLIYWENQNGQLLQCLLVVSVRIQKIVLEYKRFCCCCCCCGLLSSIQL